MKNFTYYTPTKILFGRHTESMIAGLLKEFGATKVLIHYGEGSVVRSGLLARIEGLLKEAGIAYTLLGGVKPNPRLSLVRTGAALCRSEQIDFILAVGGGSTIDSAKAIGYGAADTGEIWDFYARTRTPEACLPVGCILTIAAAGSEMSDSSVITNEDGWQKRGCHSDLGRCKFAILNPELTCTLPAYQTACGCVDILMHTMERYFNPEENMELTDGISEHLMRTVIQCAGTLKKDPHNYNARAEVMWAGSLSHNGLTGCGTGAGDWAAHQLEHELSAVYDVAHGAGLAAIWGSLARYIYRDNLHRFTRFAARVHQINEADHDGPISLALAGIRAMEDFYRSLDMPVSIRELGIDLTDEQIDSLAEKCSFRQTRTIGGVRKLNKADIAAIYRAAR